MPTVNLSQQKTDRLSQATLSNLNPTLSLGFLDTVTQSPPSTECSISQPLQMAISQAVGLCEGALETPGQFELHRVKLTFLEALLKALWEAKCQPLPAFLLQPRLSSLYVQQMQLWTGAGQAGWWGDDRLDLSAPLFRELTQHTLFSDITILYGGRRNTVGGSRLLKPSRGARVILSETNHTLRKARLICGSSGIIIFFSSHQAPPPYVFARSQLTFIRKLPVLGVMFVLL